MRSALPADHFTAPEGGVAHTVMTLISVQIGLGWHPSGIPDGIALFNIVVVSIAVERNIVITVSRQTKKLCIFIEAIATAGIEIREKKFSEPR